jgi:hypothetical protein
VQYAFFSGTGKGVFPSLLIKPVISFRENKHMQNRHYPLLLVIIYNSSTGTRFIHTEEEYCEFVRNLKPDVIAFYEAAAFQDLFRET